MVDTKSTVPATKYDTRFVGSFVNRLDSKNRLSIPPDMRRFLVTEGEAGFSGVHCLIYPGQPDRVLCGGAELIDILLDALASDVVLRDIYDEAREQTEHAILAGVVRLGFDREGRITVPETLRSGAGLEGEVAIVGRGNMFLLMPAARHDSMTKAGNAVLTGQAATMRALLLPSVSGRKRES